MKFSVVRITPGNEGKEALKWARELDELLWRWAKANKGEHLRLSAGLAIVGMEDLGPLEGLAGIYGCTDRVSGRTTASFAKLSVSQDITQFGDNIPATRKCRWPAAGGQWVSLTEATVVP